MKTVLELSELYNISKFQIYKWLKKEKIKALKIEEKWMIDESDFKNYILKLDAQNELMNLSEICNIFNISKNKMKRLIKENCFETAQKVNNTWYMELKEFEAYFYTDNPCEDFMLLSRISEKLELPYDYLQYLAINGEFNSAIQIRRYWKVSFNEVKEILNSINNRNTKDFTTKEFSKLINITDKKLRYYIEKKYIPGIYRVNNSIFIERNHGIKYLEFMEYLKTEYFPANIAAEKISKSINRLYLLIDEGLFPKSLKSKSKWYIHRNDVEKFNNPSIDSNDKLFTIEEASEVIGKSIKSTQKLVQENAFAVVELIRSRKYIRQSVLDLFISEQAEIKAKFGKLLTVKQAAELTNLTPHLISRRIQKGIFKTSEKINNIWYIQKVEVLQLLNSGYFEVDEVSEELISLVNLNKKLKEINPEYSGYLNKDSFESTTFLRSRNYITIDEANKLINAERNVLFEKEYITIKKFKDIIASYNPEFNGTISAKKFKTAKKINKRWHIKKEEIDEILSQPIFSSNFNTEYLSLVQAEEKYNITNNTLFTLIKNNKISYINLGIINKFFIEDASLALHLDNEKNKKVVFNKMDLYEKLCNDLKLDINKHIYSSENRELFLEFSLIKIQASRGQPRNWNLIYSRLKRTYKEIISKIKKKMIDCSSTELLNLLNKNSGGKALKQLAIFFLRYVYTKFNKTLENDLHVYFEPELRQVNKDEIYLPEEYSCWQEYLKQIDKHIPSALKSRHYANIWVYVIMLMTNSWRPSDIVRLIPRINIKYLNIHSLDWFKNNKLSSEQIKVVIDQIKTKLEGERTSKTSAFINFITPIYYLDSFVTAIVISELHLINQKESKINERNFQLSSLYVGETNITLSLVNVELTEHKSFILNENVPRFSATKMRNSTMTYLFNYIQDVDADSMELALDMTQWSRSHKSANTTAIYIKAINKDGDMNRISLNLFERGHFGWMYNYLIRFAYNGTNKIHTLEERTKKISKLQTSLSVIELELLAMEELRTDIDYKSSINHLQRMDQDNLKHLVNNVFSNKMPSRDGKGQCLVYKDCKHENRTTCIGCPYFIPQIHSLIFDAATEFKRLINAIKNQNSQHLIKRDSQFLMNVLFLFSEIIVNFGSSVLDIIINENERKDLIFSVADKLYIN